VNILGWADWTVHSVDELDGNRRVTASPNAGRPLVCPKCFGASRNLVKHGSKDQLFLDLPTLGLRTGILVPRQRYICRKCSATFFEALPPMDERRLMTRRLLEALRTRMFTQTFSSLADDVGVSEGLVRQIFRERVDELAARYKPTLGHKIGLDEIYLLRRSRAVICNLEQSSLIDMLEDRNKATLERFFAKFDLASRSEVRVVTIDMTRAYRDVAKASFPSAVVVADKFHVVRMANDALDDVRKHVKSGLNEAKRRTLRRDRYILLSRPDDLTMPQRIFLGTWLGSFPELALAYELKETFYAIYDAESRGEAERRFDEWKARVPRTPTDRVAAAFKPVVRAVTNWRPEVFAYFDHRVTNAKVERLNGAIRSVNHRGRGHSFEVLRAKMLFAEDVRVRQRKGYPRSWPSHAKSTYTQGDYMALTPVVGESDELPVIDFGASIDRLIQKIERGEL